jgi:hypothetical protein
MKIKKIELTNLKAVSNQSADFNGCSAIITAGNNKGKTTMLKGLINRFRSQKPEIILKEGETNGNYVMELTDGARIEWKFTDKSESFAFITKDGFKMTTGVLKAIGEKYFGVEFDIDKFLTSSPKEQSKMLANLVGLDFTEIDNRYKVAYDERTDANREVQRLRAINKTKPVEVEKPNIDSLKKELTDIQVKNSELRNKWKVDNENHQQSILNHNKEVRALIEKKKAIESEREILNSIKYFAHCIDFDSVDKYVSVTIADEKEITSLPEPEYLPETEAQQKIDNANEALRKFDNYDRDLKEFNEWVNQGKEAAKKANDFDAKVKAIQSEKLQLIAKADIPGEFKFTDDGILYNNLPLSNNQSSSSSKYIAALKLGSMALGEIKTMHFDASFLDKNSLSDVEKWANENYLQLLIERPDFDGGDIKYEIL